MDNRLIIPGGMGEKKTDSGLIIPGQTLQEPNTIPVPGMPMTSDGQIPPEAMAALAGGGGMGGMGGLMAGLLGGLAGKGGSNNVAIVRHYEDNPHAVEEISCEDILEEYKEDAMIVCDVDASGILRGSDFNVKLRTFYSKFYDDYRLMVEQAPIKEKLLGDVILTKVSDSVYAAGIFGSYNIEPAKGTDINLNAIKKGLKDLKDLVMADTAKKYQRKFIIPREFARLTPKRTKEEVIKLLSDVFDFSCVKVYIAS